MLLSLLLTTFHAHAAPPAPETHTLVYRLSVGGSQVGERTATLHIDPTVEPDVRSLTLQTRVQADAAGFTWRQRLTAFAEDKPASVHSVIDDNGEPREVQTRWTPTGWIVTQADARTVRSRRIPASDVDLSTADFLDPLTAVPIYRLEHAKVLSVETGDLYQGAVEQLGNKTFTLQGTEVVCRGVAWASPEGRVELWYDANGWLVHQASRISGYRLEATLSAPPPKGPDNFRVSIASPRIDVEDL